MTTKARVEGYQTDILVWGRSCKVILGSRKDDAARYGLLGEVKK